MGRVREGEGGRGGEGGWTLGARCTNWVPTDVLQGDLSVMTSCCQLVLNHSPSSSSPFLASHDPAMPPPFLQDTLLVHSRVVHGLENRLCAGERTLIQLGEEQRVLVVVGDLERTPPRRVQLVSTHNHAREFGLNRSGYLPTHTRHPAHTRTYPYIPTHSRTFPHIPAHD